MTICSRGSPASLARSWEPLRVDSSWVAIHLLWSVDSSILHPAGWVDSRGTTRGREMVTKQPFEDWLLVTLVSLAKESSHLLLNFLISTGAGLYRPGAGSTGAGSIPLEATPGLFTWK